MLSNHPNCLGGNGPSASSDLIGDVDGPASATDNAVARFDGTTGKLIQNSVVTIADTTGAIAGAQSLTAPASINLTLAGGSSGASLVLEQGANGSVTITPAGTGDINLTSAGSSSFVFVNGGNPILFINETDQSADARLWAMQSEAGLFKLRAFNDALSSAVDTFAATRTGNLLIGTTDSTGLTGAGGLKINSSTAGSSGAGALVVQGGISAAGASYFGGAVEITGATTLNNDVYQTALKKFYVDSGSNTYFHENSADSFQIVTGGTVASTLTAGSVLFNGIVIGPAATVNSASIRLPHGTAPTFPVNGDMWTTTAGLFIRINGATVGPLS